MWCIALELMGYDTGVNLEQLIAISRKLPSVLGHETPSQVTKAGRRLDLHPAPSNVDAIRDRALAKGTWSAHCKQWDGHEALCDAHKKQLGA